ncbi:uncharacterized protein LOC105172090 [Sesamum indicum]|uniref:Uncharacterized protein LOC105172090 n=1 Tax=Sesamum indicum TaxID=4182 RepID=A0A6I9TZF0_SESIN|nr:uncharacterized protein LOC105172090 [Sesamum indicum]
MNSVAMHEVRLINDDIVKEILSHLPVKSLLRFKTVIKSWQDIIGSWAFVKLHLENYCNNCSNNQGILVRVYDGNTHKWKLSTKFTDCSKLREVSTLDGDYFMEHIRRNEIPFYPRMVGPIDGLICIHGIRPSTPIALCNPSLAKAQFLPMFQFHRPVTPTLTDATLDSVSTLFIKISKAIMPYKNGSLSFSHWLALKRVGRVAGPNYSILSFNMQNEVFELTPVPPCVHGAAYKRKVELGFLPEVDSLLLFVHPLRRQNSREDVCFERWVLNGLGAQGRWTRLSSIRIRPLKGIPKPVVVWNSDVLIWEESGKKNRLVFYNYCTREITNVIVIPPKQCAPRVLGYKGSLISPAIFMKTQL